MTDIERVYEAVPAGVARTCREVATATGLTRQLVSGYLSRLAKVGRLEACGTEQFMDTVEAPPPGERSPWKTYAAGSVRRWQRLTRYQRPTASGEDVHQAVPERNEHPADELQESEV